MTRGSTAPRLRRATGAGAALLLALTLGACGSDSDDPEGGSKELPSAAELEAALISVDDLPDGFEVEPADEGDDEDENSFFDESCFADVSKLSEVVGDEPVAKPEVEMTAESETGVTIVSGQVSAYEDEDAMATALDDLIATVQDCPAISSTDDDGSSVALDITYDDTADLDGADAQLAIAMVGTITISGQELPAELRYLIVRTGPLISFVGSYAVGEDTTGVTDDVDGLAATQVERFVATLG